MMLCPFLGSDPFPLTPSLYDAENRLTDVAQSGQAQLSFFYDGDGGRTKKIVHGAMAGGDAPAMAFPELLGGAGEDDLVTHYVGSLYERSNISESRHIYAGDRRIASVTEGEVRFVFDDHLGSPNVITDEAGQVLELMEYQPFGNFSRHDVTGQEELNVHKYFTGQTLDEESGLYYYNARYYDPGLGRFVSSDPTVQHPNDPQDLNRYAYCRNNPVNLIDPSGYGWLSDFFDAFVDTWKYIHDPTQWNPVLHGITTGDWDYARDVAIAAGTGFITGGPLGAATAMTTVAIMRTPMAQFMVETKAHQIYDDILGMNPETAYITSYVTTSIAVGFGAESYLSGLSGGQELTAVKYDPNNPDHANAYNQQGGTMQGDMFGPAPDGSRFDVSELKILVDSNGKAVGVYGEAPVSAFRLDKELSFLNVNHTGVKTTSYTGNTISPWHYGSWGVCHTTTNATLLSSGYSSTLSSLGLGGWSTHLSTFVYGNYGGGLYRSALQGYIANREVHGE